ncbi:MAG TPA: MerR family transcriptional regulator [Acidimicrobiales bacterium]|nr:MerR family transcriptional regulator [Acidimicrobiales bacterium]
MTSGASDPGRLIGDVARQLGISTRTLRYYEERGLIEAQPRATGNRRYRDADVDRVVRIRELQSMMGFNLDEIAAILAAEDDLARLRAEWQSGQPTGRRDEIVREALAINRRLQDQVHDKLDRLQKFLDELEGNARRYRRVAREIAAERDQ